MPLRSQLLSRKVALKLFDQLLKEREDVLQKGGWALHTLSRNMPHTVYHFLHTRRVLEKRLRCDTDAGRVSSQPRVMPAIALVKRKIASARWRFSFRWLTNYVRPRNSLRCSFLSKKLGEAEPCSNKETIKHFIWVKFAEDLFGYQRWF